MHFTLRHLRALQLTVLTLSTSVFHPANADWNPNGNNDNFIDTLSDASCPNQHSGRLSVDNCRGYVDCMNGFEIDRATCDEGMLFSARSENCEPAESVPFCASLIADRNPGRDDGTGPPTSCGEGQCITPDGGCGVMHQCLIDPCEMTRCEENEECVASFCGGCHATCSLKLHTIDQLMDEPGGYVTTSPPETTPRLIDDGGMWVPDNASGSGTSSTSPQIVYDDNDAVAPWSTTLAPSTTKENVVVDPTPRSPSEEEVFIPSWSDHTCVASTTATSKNKNRRLGSSRHIYSTQYECCVNNFIYSLELFESCIGFDIELLEPSPQYGDVDYYPVWKESQCKLVEGTEDGWLETSYRPKKYLCCFEFFKWDFDNCLLA